MTNKVVRKLVDQMKKKFPGMRKMGLLRDEGIQVPQEVFSTTSLALDYRIKYGGIPRAKITHLYGPERSLKTTVALKAALEGLRRHPDGFVVFVDFERNYDTKESISHLYYLGYTNDELDRVIYLRDNPEECFNAVEEYVQDVDCLAVIVDSVGGMISGRSFDKGFEENQKIGLQPVLISDIVKRLNNKNLNAALILINQARDNMNTMGRGPEYKYSGGRTLRHLIHLSIDLNGWHQKTDKDKESANAKIMLRARIDKCKIGGENSQTQVEFDLSTGLFDRQLDCITLGYQLGVLNNAGSWFSMYDGINGGTGEIIFKKQGGEPFETEIKKTPELWQHIEKLILEEIGSVKRIDWSAEESSYEESEDVSDDQEIL